MSHGMVRREGLQLVREEECLPAAAVGAKKLSKGFNLMSTLCIASRTCHVRTGKGGDARYGVREELLWIDRQGRATYSTFSFSGSGSPSFGANSPTTVWYAL